MDYNNLTTTISKNRTVISVDGYSLNERGVNSYNNCFTRGLARLFRLAIDVKINDKLFCLNKNSYQKLLRALEVDQVENLNSELFSVVLQTTRVSKSNFHSVNLVIDQHVQEKLDFKLAQAISNSDQQKAIELINMGANLRNQWFVKKGGQKLLSNVDNHDGYTFTKGECYYYFGNIAFLAHKKNLENVSKVIKERGHDYAILGFKYKYKRVLTRTIDVHEERVYYEFSVTSQTVRKWRVNPNDSSIVKIKMSEDPISVENRKWYGRLPNKGAWLTKANSNGLHLTSLNSLRLK